ncbi:MAG: hypothetical protein ACYC2U_06210 [Candidatus Amoebophilus sp.]
MNLVIKYLFILILIFVLKSCRDPYKLIYGNWKIYKYNAQGIVGFTDEEAKALIGKQISLFKKYVIIDNSKIENPIYEFREENANDYFYGYRIHKEDIGIQKDVIKILEINIIRPQRIPSDLVEHREKYLAFYLDELIFYNGELIFNIDGVFFYLKK